jgi:hypothetical protein
MLLNRMKMYKFIILVKFNNYNNNNNILLFHQAVTRNKQGYNKHWSVKIY